MTIKEWIQRKALSFLGLSKYNGTPGDDRETFINDDDSVRKAKIREYNIWYSGDSDELLNFYTRQNTLDYNYEPWYDRNKRSYFWAISSTEEDIKRTHSGQPRNIIDTLVAVVGKPEIIAGAGSLGRDNRVNNNIDHIIKENNFWKLYTQIQMPLTLVEGWGCYKINWDMDVSDYPIIQYYKAENVEFIFKNNRMVGVIFKDYYTDGKNKKYLLTETRSLESVPGPSGIRRNVHIIKEAFEVSGEDDFLKPIALKDVEQFKNLEKEIIIDNFNKLFAVPTIFYEDTNTDNYGRSVYTGKLDLFDDLDQCLSQTANTVRRSTTVEYFNTDFLERDRKTGMPIQPKAYDRKYTMYTGGRTGDGTVNTSQPVQVTQPQVNFQQYSDQAVAIMMQIVNGLMSPATLGIDIAKKDNAEAQREKEKVTIFTRNIIIDTESDILKDLFSQALCAYELMHKGEITVKEYDMSINYSEFADDSFENKLTVLGDAYDKKNISPKMYMSKLYGHSLSDDDYQSELEFLETSKKEMESPFGNGMPMPQDEEEETDDEEEQQEPFK